MGTEEQEKAGQSPPSAKGNRDPKGELVRSPTANDLSSTKCALSSHAWTLGRTAAAAILTALA